MHATYLIGLLQDGEALGRALRVIMIFVRVMDERETTERTLSQIGTTDQTDCQALTGSSHKRQKRTRVVGAPGSGRRDHLL